MPRSTKVSALAVAVGLILIFVPLADASPSPASSPTAQACTPSPMNPVVNDSMPFTLTTSSGSFFVYTYTYDHPFVMRNGTGYTMWLTGAHQTNSSLTQGIYAANSPDGVHWKVRPTPVLTNGPKGSWDQGTVYSPWVVWNGTMFLMYFTGVNSTVQSRSIGLAFSKDNVHWSEYGGNPIVKGGPGAYDAYWARYASVIFENGTYKMWYTGHTLITSAGLNVTIDYATSGDGIHWTKYPANPVFRVLYSPGYYWSEHGFVARVAGGYLMAYDDEQNISYAYSSDGISWTNGPYPLLRAPTSGTWSNGSTIFPDLLVNGSEVLLWYSGYGGHLTQTGGYTGGVGLAYCPLVVIPTTFTTTVVRTTTLFVTTTMVSTATVETTVQAAPSSDLPYYQAGVVALGAVAVGLGLLATRRHTTG